MRKSDNVIPPEMNSAFRRYFDLTGVRETGSVSARRVALYVRAIGSNTPRGWLIFAVFPNATTLECTPELAAKYLDCFMPTESLEQVSEKDLALLSEDGNLCQSYDEQLHAIELCDLVQKGLSTFGHREQKVIFLRYGFEDGTVHTLEEIGIEFGVTRERIRQIEGKVIRKLRSSSHAKELAEFL